MKQKSSDHPTSRKYSNAEFIDIIHQITTFYSSTRSPRDYGMSEKYTSVEVHTLKYIVDHPGITVTELALDNGKTKSAISQILKKLEQKGLIYRVATSINQRNLLYPTDKGLELDTAHRSYDEVHSGDTLSRLRAVYSDRDIDLAGDILESWLSIRRDVHRKRLHAGSNIEDDTVTGDGVSGSSEEETVAASEDAAPSGSKSSARRKK